MGPFVATHTWSSLVFSFWGTNWNYIIRFQFGSLEIQFEEISNNVVLSILNLFIYLFIYLWLRWVFVSVRGLSLVVASGGHSSSRCVGLSPSRPLLLRSTGSRHTGSVIVAHGPSCSVACGIFPDQGSNPCPLHCQADSQPLRHQGSPCPIHFNDLSGADGDQWTVTLFYDLMKKPLTYVGSIFRERVGKSRVKQN